VVGRVPPVSAEGAHGAPETPQLDLGALRLRQGRIRRGRGRKKEKGEQ